MRFDKTNRTAAFPDASQRRWWKESVVYQIYPKSFCDTSGSGTGDLAGITGKVDYLIWLGVDVLWLSPIYPSPDCDNGYDISDYEDIDPRYGNMADFDTLLAEAHRRDLRVVMDLVVNHSSDQHPWFLASRSGRDNPLRDFYIWRDGRGGGPPNNWGSLFGGPAWTLDLATGQYYLHLFSPGQPDLNWQNPALRQEIYGMMRRWLERGVDGFRMDVLSLISKPDGLPDAPIGPNGFGDYRPLVSNGPRVHDYLREMRREVLSRYDIMSVGEASGVTLEEARRYAGRDGKELDIVFQFEHMNLDGGETFKWNDQKIPLPALKQVLDKWQAGMEGRGWNTLFWCNHDQPRIVSRLGDEGAWRERSAKMLATCLHLMKGTPFVYQGEEIGMTNMPFSDPGQLRDLESLDAYHTYTANGRFTPEEMLRYIRLKSRDNARTPMQWNSGPNAGFSGGKPWMEVNPNYQTIHVEEQRARPDSVLAHYRRLIRLRRENPIAVYGTYAPVSPEDHRVYAYTRTLGDLIWLVVCNFTSESVSFSPPAAFASGAEIVLSNLTESHYITTHRLAPYEATVLCQAREGF
ncbi:MAG: alpha-glucosidase [Clostridiales bacterium]|nr:alpha-glucosidase [Clostridiales bacterium]